MAVEANPSLCADLRDRFAAEIETGRVVLIDKAISRRPKVTLYEMRDKLAITNR